MIWLFMAIWMNGHDPRDYKLVAKVGPFQTMKQCWGTGVLSANAIQSKDDVSNALGACKEAQPTFIDFHGMWDMVCLFEGKPEICWLKPGFFSEPIK